MSENTEMSVETIENTGENVSKTIANAGWADVMKKILKSNKPKKKKSLVLSRAKKLQDTEKETTEKQVSSEDRKDITSKSSIDDEEKFETRLKSRRKNIALGIRVKPSINDRGYERILQKIATKGVVQLFNAVHQQQREIDRKLGTAGPLERKREQVYKDIDKRAFLDVLMGGSKSIAVSEAVESKKSLDNENDSKMWSVLRDDFVMGAKLKDWDKINGDDDDSSAPEEIDSDD